MAEAQIDKQRFAAPVLREPPELKDDSQEWDDREQRPMAGPLRFTERSASDRNRDTVKECLSVADSLLHQGNVKGKDAVYVSFRDDLPRQGGVPDRLRERILPELGLGWDHAISYLDKLLGKRSS
jgi:hypothetical protein